MNDACYFLVSGRVQRVCFRASTCDRANALGLCGWVRNRADGCVEGMASGPSAALTEFRKWLGQGPSAARVERVVFECGHEAPPGDRFVIR